jgi:hypothetical protein
MILFFVIAVGWPLTPMDSTHAIGNNWGEFQRYGAGTAPYFHPGIDVMGITTGKKVFAVRRGIVRAWLTTQATEHWRLAIADTNITTDSVEAWLYAHIDPNRFHRNVGNMVNAGDSIGYLVTWPVTGFDHCHFARIKDIGATWSTADWAFIQNPLRIITPYVDTAHPVFLNAQGTNKFAFRTNNTTTYQTYNNLHGNVDVIAKIYDETGLPLTFKPIWEQIIPYKIQWEFHGQISSATQLSAVFNAYLYWDDTMRVKTVFSTDATCNTRGDYDYRDYYFIVTNTDGDSLIESSDAAYSWTTASYPDGWYWVVITAYDAAGNSTKDSMQVRLVNGTFVAENGNPAPTTALGIKPNPNFGSFASRIGLPLKIYDASGRIVATGMNRFAELLPGIYFAVGKIDGRTVAEKIVIIGK